MNNVNPSVVVKTENVTPCSKRAILPDDMEENEGIDRLLALDEQLQASTIELASNQKLAETIMHNESPVSDTNRLARAHENNVIRMMHIEGVHGPTAVNISNSPVPSTHGIRPLRLDDEAEAVMAIEGHVRVWLGSKFKIMPNGFASFSPFILSNDICLWSNLIYIFLFAGILCFLFQHHTRLGRFVS